MATTFDAYDFADHSSDGLLREDKSGTLCISISLYGNNRWEPLSELSAGSWMKYRCKIREGLEGLRKKMKRNKKAAQKAQIAEETKRLFDDLYKKMNESEKREFLTKHKDTWLSKATCTACLHRCDDKIKCLHSDCPGMCKKCAEKLETCENCPACNKKQEICCPICMEDKKASELVKSVGCCHSVCWKCYGMAFRSGHPILNCPMCRCTFTEHTVDDSSDDDVLDDIFESDDDSDDEVNNELNDEDFIRLLENSNIPEDQRGVAIDIISAVNQAVGTSPQEDINILLGNSVGSFMTQSQQNMSNRLATNMANGVITL